MKTKIVSANSAVLNNQTAKNTLAIFLIAFSAFTLNGCQMVQKSAQDLRSTIDQTVQSGKEKADSLRSAFTDKTDEAQKSLDQVKKQVDEAKNALDTKVQQVQDAGQKLTDAQKAINDANLAVSKITK